MKVKVFKENIAKLRKGVFIAGASLSLVGLAASSSACVVDKSQNEKEIETDSNRLSESDLRMMAEVISHESSPFDDELFIRNRVKSNIDSVKYNNTKEVATGLNNNIDVFHRKSVNEHGDFVPSLDDYDVCTKLTIVTADDTQSLLEAYNSELKGMKLTVADLEFMTQDGLVSIKREDGSYTQISMHYCYIDDLYDNAVIVRDLNTNPVLVHDLNTNTSSYKVIEKQDMLTGKKIDTDDLENNDFHTTKVGDYIMNNDINFSAYTFPIKPAWTSNDQETIVKKYGMEVWNCVKKYGLPTRMYKAKDFYNNSKRMVKN